MLIKSVAVNVAVWGTGPEQVSLRCGAPVPADFTATSQLFDVNGVSWHAHQLEGVTVFTAVSRRPYVAVRVPDSVAGSTVLADVTAALTELSQRKPVPRASAERSNRSTSAG